MGADGRIIRGIGLQFLSAFICVICGTFFGFLSDFGIRISDFSLSLIVHPGAFA
jgi:hypothetical protein